jgi:hypothetical protein
MMYDYDCVREHLSSELYGRLIEIAAQWGQSRTASTASPLAMGVLQPAIAMEGWSSFLRERERERERDRSGFSAAFRP